MGRGVRGQGISYAPDNKKGNNGHNKGKSRSSTLRRSASLQATIKFGHA